MQTVNRTSRRLDSILHEAGHIFEVASNIQYRNLKKNPIAVDVLSKAYPMVPYHSHADPIWPDGTRQNIKIFIQKKKLKEKQIMKFFYACFYAHTKKTLQRVAT
jgi:hypothetical protein